jgi:Domain of unknown function (DUF1998)
MTQSSYRYRVGELRPSQILFSFGVGAIVDLPNLSAMVMGLEDWNESYGIEVAEERLLSAVRRDLGPQVKQLKTPPVALQEESSNPFDEAARIGIPVAPFPSWVVCPRCRLLAPLQSGFFEIKPSPYRPQETHYIHQNCPKPGKPPMVIPARFLVACERGHLDDFPWSYFVHRGNGDCRGPLRLEEYGVSGTASDIRVKCDGCNTTSRLLSDAFGEQGKKNMPRCRGRHPHLRSFDESCGCQMRSILLGASNSWFGISLSALSIPTKSGKLAQLITEHWTKLGKAPSLDILKVLLDAFQATGQLQEFSRYSTEDIWIEIEQKRLGQDHTESVDDLKTPEWEIFSAADPSRNTKEFQLRPCLSPQGYERWFSKVVLLERLREVQALIGFTRIQSPGDFEDAGQIPDEYRVSLGRRTPQWVPTIEVKGEGIFLEFNETMLRQWEQRSSVKEHQKQSWEAHRRWCQSRSLDPSKIRFPGIRYMLIHSFSHALMRQLAIECGYNAASLKERLYSKPANEDNGPQAGLLIYTATPDSEGTLGGLVSLGEPAILGHHIAQALEQMRLCASDPLCAEHDPRVGMVSLHWAACHACLFSPETSCERGNKYLDRNLLIPTLKPSELAFFQ